MARAPKRFHDFIGQSRVIAELQGLINGSVCQGRPVPHLLILGKAGWGKSSLVEAVERESGATRLVVNCSKTTKPWEVEGQLTLLEHGDILHLEEGHLLGQPETLFMALDEGRIPGSKRGVWDAAWAAQWGTQGTRQGTQTPKFTNVAPFTLIVTTNEPGKLKPALRSRLHTVELDRYSAAELKAIVVQAAKAEELELTGQAAGLVGQTSLGCPRVAQQRVERLRITTLDRNRVEVGDVRKLLAIEGVDEIGLRPNHRMYLEALANARDRKMSLETLVAKLGLDAAYIKVQVEEALLDLELVVINSRHRIITPEGLKVAGKILDQPESNKNKGEKYADDQGGQAVS